MEASTRTDGAQSPSATRKALTIGAVAKILSREFEDISISKIRYLEDQKLLSPRRTPGGYRLYSQADVERLRAILRMQRDEFLPLRVIRQELASGGDRSDPRGGEAASLRRAGSVDPARASRMTIEELVDQTGVSPEVIADLEEWRIIQPEKFEGQLMYSDTDREIVKACGELARFGVAGRNLRALRTSADREAALLEQVMSAALRSSNHNRRREAIENLETLAASTSNLTHMLLVRDLRKLTGEE
jgi:DNA-binding transcriptional MerR regulator